MKKRALAFGLALSLMVSACPVFAANFSWESTVSATNVQVGDTFNLDLDVTENPGINNATIDIKYNPTVVVPVATVDPADDILSYSSNYGYDVPLFDYNYVDGIIGRTDTSTGNLRVANYISEADSEGILKETTSTGTLVRVTFKAVGEGDANLKLGDIAQVVRTPAKSTGDMGYTISLPSVSVGSTSSSDNSSNTNATTTTETTTEATTKASTSSSSSSSSSSSKTTTTTITTTEAVTEVTTAEAVTETTTATAVAASFTDLDDYPWAIEYINTLAKEGIVNGYSDNTFKPGDNVKRADFIIMLLRAMGVDTTATPQSNFTDVSSDKYYCNAVGLAKDMGIASGNLDGTFNPESNITRQDMMILAKKAVEMKTSTTLTGDASVLDKFADKDNISAYAVDSLAAMVQAGIVNGTGDNIQPKDNTTRAQAAVIICKVLDMMK